MVRRVLIYRFLCVINGNNSSLIFASGIFKYVCVRCSYIIVKMLVKLLGLQPGVPQNKSSLNSSCNYEYDLNLDQYFTSIFPKLHEHTKQWQDTLSS